jgi:hypothetical protein
MLGVHKMLDKQQGQCMTIVRNGLEVQILPYGGCNHSKCHVSLSRNSLSLGLGFAKMQE